MANAIIAVALFVLILSGLAALLGRAGNLAFWKLAAQLPEEAFNWVATDPAWIVLDADEPAPGEGFAGPFFLFVPNLGRRVKLYAHENEIEQSQRRFVERHISHVPRRGFAYPSALALVYPVAAMLSLSTTTSPTLSTLGYGFANLGYLLAVAFILPGHFRVLGLDTRLPTLAAAIVFWAIGFALSNAF